jgi:non-specific serine/threonine protein kinase
MPKETANQTTLELSPHGIVLCRVPTLLDFKESDAAGLISLAGRKQEFEPDTSVHFWKDFAGRFLKALCHIPDGDAPIAPKPDTAELAEIMLNAPPMRGAEYLSPDVLSQIWDRMQQQVDQADSLADFLTEKAPLWSRVGRITLHLAENANDPEYPFAFMATYAAGLSQNGRIKQLPLGKALKEYAGADNRPMLLKLLAPLHQAAKQSALIADLIETGDIFHPMTWLPAEAYQFLCGIPEFEDSGLIVRIPDWWQKRTRRPQVAITVGDEKSAGVGINALVRFRMEVEIDGRPVTPEELHQLLAGEDGLIMLRGQWIEVDRAKLQQALAHWEALERRGGIPFAEGMRLLAGAPRYLASAVELEEHREWAFTRPGSWVSELLEQLRNPEQLAPPETLNATLRPYQLAGLNWLWFCAQTGLGACLADDMGLGKTIQILAALLRKKAERPNSAPALLIVPASLIGNWQRESEKFAPSLSLFIAHRQYGRGLSRPSSLSRPDLIITTYGMLTRLTWLAETDWSWIILDEAQAIKNHATRQSRAVRNLRAEARFALTGTPIENRLGDLWSLFDFLNPGLLGSSTQFAAFTQALQSGNREHYAPLRRLVSPYILRRLKSDKSIIADLPDKTEMKVFCGLTARQAKLYQQSVQQLLAELKESDEGIQRKGLVLTYLMRFKQICNHPDQATGQHEYEPAHSAKFKRIEQLCGEIESRGEKVLVFTQFKEMTEPLADCLAAVFGRRGLILHGGTPVKKRQEMVEQFQREDGPPFFILSLKAGGTGLNLTAASHVIHFDRWWNPAIENQATDRAYRIGQKRNVLVHKFVTSGTLEEKIDALLTDKQNTADQILTGSAEKTLTEMSDAELLNMIRLDLEQTEI